ncbi:reverse transcriptase [Trichonephila clavipes]|nr:reverse transcriptase [Trichonephila clavipes]
MWHEMCDMLRRLVGTTAPGHHDCSIQKVSNHGSIPITIDCNVVACIVFEEGFHQPIKRTIQFIEKFRQLWEKYCKNLTAVGLAHMYHMLFPCSVGVGWLCRLFENSTAVRKNATKYNIEVSAVCEATAQLITANPAPAKVVFSIDSQAAISALSSNIPTDCLNTIQCWTKIAERISYGWTVALQWVTSHVGIPGNIDKYTVVTQNTKSLGKPCETLATVGPIPRHLERDEAIASFRLAPEQNVKSGKGPLTPAGLLKLVKRFEETGKLEDRARAGRPCLKEARAPCIAVEMEAIASEAASGNSSAREAARRLGHHKIIICPQYSSSNPPAVPMQIAIMP